MCHENLELYSNPETQHISRMCLMLKPFPNGSEWRTSAMGLLEVLEYPLLAPK